MCMVNEMKRRIDDLEARLANITERLTRLSLGADAVIKADQSGTAGDKNNAMGQLIGALYRAKDEGPGVRSAIEEVDRLKAQNARLREALIACHNAHDDFYIESPEICKVIESTPAQSLADIQARAVETLKSRWSQDLEERQVYTSFEILDALDHEISRLKPDRGGSGYDREVLGQNNEEGAV